MRGNAVRVDVNLWYFGIYLDLPQRKPALFATTIKTNKAEENIKSIKRSTLSCIFSRSGSDLIDTELDRTVRGTSLSTAVLIATPPTILVSDLDFLLCLNLSTLAASLDAELLEFFSLSDTSSAVDLTVDLELSLSCPKRI